MTSQTIATVPLDLSDLSNFKGFLLKLVEELDKALGYRGLPRNITRLSIGEIITILESNVAELAIIQQETPINELDYTLPTISVTYSQPEIEALATDIKTIADKVDVVLNVLKEAKVLS